MKYLFLDDERVPKDVTWLLFNGSKYWSVDWEIVRSFEEAKKWVLKYGFPEYISFDHDLGLMHYANDYSDEKTGYHFAKWLVEYDLDTNTMPNNFKFMVHSKNTVGAENIKKLLQNYMRSKGMI